MTKKNKVRKVARRILEDRDLLELTLSDGTKSSYIRIGGRLYEFHDNIEDIEDQPDDEELPRGNPHEI